jgi:hypothetical protein
MGEKRNRFKETLEWLHHAYWIHDFIVSTGAVGIAATWLAKHYVAFMPYAWAAGFVAVGLSLYLSAFIRSHITKGGPQASDTRANLALQAGADNSLPSNVNVAQFFRVAYRSHQESEVRKNFRLLAQQYSPDDHEKFYLEFLGVGFIQAIFDNIWWIIFRSQLLVLLEINRSDGVAALSDVKRFYDEAAKTYPKEYAKYDTTFDKWLGYLISNGLVLHHPSPNERIEITVRGKDFLKYLTHWGKGPDSKRL